MIREGSELATAADVRQALVPAEARVLAIRAEQDAALEQHRWSEGLARSSDLVLAEAWVAHLRRYLATLETSAAGVSEGPTVAELKASVDERRQAYFRSIEDARSARTPASVARAFEAWRELYTAASAHCDAAGLSKAGLQSLGVGPREDLRELAQEPALRGAFGPARR